MKPRVDITESGGSRWTMGKLVSDALAGKMQDHFLKEFNEVAVEGTDDDVVAVLMEWAVLIFEGEPVRATVESVTSTTIVVPEDPDQRLTEAADYLTAIVTLDVDEAGYQNVVILLADVKAMIDAIEAKRKDLTKGARETVTKINAEFKPAEDTYKRAEVLLKGKLVEFRADITSIRDKFLTAGEDPPEPVPEVEGVTVREKWDIRVDKHDLPIDYLVPDLKAIEKALKAGKTIPGVIGHKVETLAVEHKRVQR